MGNLLQKWLPFIERAEKLVGHVHVQIGPILLLLLQEASHTLSPQPYTPQALLTR